MSQCETCGARVRAEVCSNDYCPSNIEKRAAHDIVGGGCMLFVWTSLALVVWVVGWVVWKVWNLP